MNIQSLCMTSLFYWGVLNEARLAYEAGMEAYSSKADSSHISLQ